MFTVRVTLYFAGEKSLYVRSVRDYRYRHRWVAVLWWALGNLPPTGRLFTRARLL